MTRDPRYDVLFESVPIGPVTAKNRFIRFPIAPGWRPTGRVLLFVTARLRPKEAVGDTCAVALRFSVDELMGEEASAWCRFTLDGHTCSDA